MEQTIAETKVIVRGPNGEDKHVHIVIGCPYRISEEEAACPVSMDGLYAKISDIHGSDTFHALTLALGFVTLTFKKMEEKGYSFHFENGEDAPIEAWLSGM